MSRTRASLEQENKVLRRLYSTMRQLSEEREICLETPKAHSEFSQAMQACQRVIEPKQADGDKHDG